MLVARRERADLDEEHRQVQVRAREAIPRQGALPTVQLVVVLRLQMPKIEGGGVSSSSSASPVAWDTSKSRRASMRDRIVRRSSVST